MGAKSETDARDGITLAGRFWRLAARAPERPALWSDGATTSYGDLARDAARIAGWLARNGLAQGARVGVLAERGRDAVAAILGTSLAGAAYVPLNPAHPPARLATLLARAELHALLFDAGGGALLDGGALADVPERRLALTAGHGGCDGPEELARAQPLDAPVPVARDALAYLMFTSGSTGEPKGVMVSAGAVQHYLDCIAGRYDLNPSDRVSQFFELTFDLSVHDLFATLNAGAQLFVLPAAARFAPVRFAAEHRLTVWFSVPSTAAFLARVKGLSPGALPDLRLTLFCGESLPTDSVQQWRAAAPASRIENLYGPTEATIACLAQPCEDELRVTEDRGCVAIGRPLDGTRAAVVDGEGRFLPDGETGELALFGPQLAAGYWRDRELTQRRFPTLDHPALGPSRWYLTGDLARRDADGVFHHLGRVDHQVQVLGHRVELEEVEGHLRAVSGSGSAGVVAWPVNAGVAEGLVAFVGGSETPAEEILAGLRARVPAYMVPRRVVALDALPHSLHGKLDRAALAAWLQREGHDRPA